MATSNNVGITQTTNILPVQALYDPTTLAFITFIGPAGTPFTGTGGGVSSVQVSGGTTGLTTSGGPIVSSGTITLGGTLVVSNGGTGSTTANGAINNLLPSQDTHAGKYLTTDGTNTSWSTSGANLSIVNDTSTNSTRYLTFTDVNTGVITQEYVSSSKLTYNPSSGTVSATTFVGALTGNASTATSATTSTNLAGGSANSIPYQSSSGTTTFLAVGTNGQYLVVSGGVPTWTSVSTVSSFSGGTTGLTPSTATTGAVTLAGTLAVANGGTGVTSSSGASSVVLRDTNANATANIFFSGFTNTAAAGTTTTLLASSTPNWVVTGSGGQTFKLPDATTLSAGIIYTFNNNQTSGAITVNNNSGTLVVSVPSGGFVTLTLLTNSTAAGTWDYHYGTPANASWSTNTLNWPGSITNTTWNGVAIGATYGGTGQTTYTTGDILYASATNTLSKLSAGTNGYVLTLASGVPTWASTASSTTITDDTSTNSTRYLNFTSATSGTLSTIYTSSTKLQYNPSTGALTSTSLTPTNAVGIAYGGTGQTTASAGFNALSPITTTGDLIIGNGTNSATRLPIGTSGYVLTSNGTTATWSSSGSGSGTVNSGTQYQIGYYATTGTAISGSTNIKTDANGNLGILATTPNTWLSGWGAYQAGTSSLISGPNNTFFGTNIYLNASGNWTYQTTNPANLYGQSNGSFVYYTVASGTAGTTATLNQIMTLDASGNLLLGTSSPVLNGKFTTNFSGVTSNSIVLNETANTSSSGFIVFAESGTSIGSISRVATTSAVAYNTTSDQRLKSNIENANPILEKLIQVKVRQYDWTEGQIHQDYGFIAQEIEPILSGVVTKGNTEKDMWQLDYSRLTPHLVKAIQELSEKVTALEAKLGVQT
jgi:hypothetical protein